MEGGRGATAAEETRFPLLETLAARVAFVPVDVTTLVIAVIGAVTGVASLVWSVATHVLSGGRVVVELLGGWTGPHAVMTAPLTRKPIPREPNYTDTPGPAALRAVVTLGAGKERRSKVSPATAQDLAVIFGALGT